MGRTSILTMLRRRTLMAASALLAIITLIVAWSQFANAAVDPATATQATINGVTRTIDGVNKARETNQLILYTRTSTQTATPTNQYGTEVTVNQSTGAITAINNRLANGSTAGTPIPEGSYVLSGHGWGVATGGYEFLLKNAQVGRIVTLTGAEATPAQPPAATTLRYVAGSKSDVQGWTAADTYASGGSRASVLKSAVDTSKVADPAPQAVYQRERYGNMTYTFTGLKPEQQYKLRLHLNEGWANGPNTRVFDVAVNDTKTFSDLDIYKEAGGKNIALIKEASIAAPANGTIKIQFTSKVNNAKIDGFEFIPVETTPTPVDPDPTDPVDPTEPEPPAAPDPTTAKTISINGVSRTINGANTARGTNQLVVYTRTGSQTTTPTNQYGIEVTIDQTSQRITAINNRLASGSTAGTPIPEGSYVLSGHGWGVATGGYEFLLKNAQVGRSVALDGATLAGSPDPLPALVPSKDNIVAGYWNMWNSKPIAQVGAEAPQYNLYYLAFAVGSEARDGRVSFDPTTQSRESLKTDIAAAKDKGTKFVISIGGGYPIHDRIRLNSDSAVNNMYNSLVSIIDEYKLDGIDFDIECGWGCMTPQHAAQLTQRLIGRYGDAFIISMAPRPYEIRSNGSIYAETAKAIGGQLDLIGMQYYDAADYWNVATLNSIAERDLNALESMGIPTSKVLIGAITYSGHSMANQPVSVYRDLYLRQKQLHPGLKGAFVWDMTYDEKTGWEFAREMGKTVRGL